MGVLAKNFCGAFDASKMSEMGYFYQKEAHIS